MRQASARGAVHTLPRQAEGKAQLDGVHAAAVPVHDVLPTGEVCPAGQGVQKDAPLLAEKVFAVHGEQAAALVPPSSLKVPAVQA